MGRWKPGESDEYVRNQILMTNKILQAVALSRKTKKVICSCDELTLERLERFCFKKGMPAADVRDMLGALRKGALRSSGKRWFRRCSVDTSCGDAGS